MGALASASVLLLAAPLIVWPAPQGGATIAATAAEMESLSTLVRLLERADLDRALGDRGPFTLFAPTDAAFAKLGPEVLATLSSEDGQARLATLLKFHVVGGDLDGEQLAKLPRAITWNGQRVTFDVDEEGARVDDSRVIGADIECSNGVIHVVDTVLSPVHADLTEVAKDFGALLRAAEAAGWTERLRTQGPFTWFAPTDAAFAALPDGTFEELLKSENKRRLIALVEHHLVEGRVYADQLARLESAPTVGGGTLRIARDDERRTVDGAIVLATDTTASNGVIHAIDRVLLRD